MAVFKCGHCGIEGHHSPHGSGIIREPNLGRTECEQALTCDSCGRMTVVLASDNYIDPYFGRSNPQWSEYWNSIDVQEWAPVWIAGQDFKDVPEHISEPASEAHKIFSIGAIRSAVLMSRAVIEASCKDKGVTSGTLAKKIDAMHSADHINQFTKEVAHTIRTFGNDMAHGDFIEDLDAEDAKEVMAFMDEFLLQVYQIKARLGRLKGSARTRSNQAPVAT